MKVVVLGAGGAVGEQLCGYLANEAHVEVYRWDRESIPLDDFQAVTHHLQNLQPDYVYNLAIASDGSDTCTLTVNTKLPVLLAKISKLLGFKLIQTSSVMVFSDRQPGPLLLSTRPSAGQGYGFEKRSMEEQIVSEAANAVVVRLGWQIGSQSGSNNMVDFLEKQSQSGSIRASTQWFPSCSYLTETAELLWAMRNFPPDLYQFNTNEGDCFYTIAARLKKALGKTHWNIAKDDEIKGNQLMVDPRTSGLRDVNL